MSRIQILPDPLISQIAAGEVVERPASVVKELLENALDAGATRLDLDLEGGGRRQIRLADDGCGMDGDDALLAFDRHATSKIRSFADLEHIASLGFRGEALAAIGSVAKVELLTAESPGSGTRVRVEGGRIKLAEPASRPRGTTIEVRSLFWNVPARAKFLKSGQTELRRAVEVVQGYVLARPDVAMTVRHEGRLVLEAPAARASGTSGRRERIRQLFGDLADKLVELPGSNAGEPPLGFVGEPETARARRSFVFVNGRLVRDRQVLAAFYRAVRDEWRSDEFPALFLYLELPPEEVDVNVHPQKAEVRFRDPGLIDRLYATFRHGLAHARGEEPASLRTPRPWPSASLAWQGSASPVGDATSDSTAGEPSARPDDGSGLLAPQFGARRVPVSWQGFGPRDASGEVRERFSGGAGWETTSPVGAGVGPGTTPYGPDSTEGAAAGNAPWTPGGPRLPMVSLTPLSGGIVPLSGRSGEQRPFRVLGQYKGTLILLEGPDGLYLVDQHVAHERVLYERLRRDLLAATTPSQTLMVPTLLELAPAERLRLLELAGDLTPCGFELAELSGSSVAVTAIPAALSIDQAARLLVALGSEVRSEQGDGVSLRATILESLAASLACKAAVKMHHPLGLPQMQSLISELFAADQPYACPHGRPTTLALTDVDLERRFGRRG